MLKHRNTVSMLGGGKPVSYESQVDCTVDGIQGLQDLGHIVEWVSRVDTGGS